MAFNHVTSWASLANILLIFPELLDAEDVEFLPVDVGQEPVRLPHGVSVGGPAAVAHQVHAVTCSQHRDRTEHFVRPARKYRANSFINMNTTELLHLLHGEW